MAVVLITGCSSGFGLETALAFARHGDTTIATMRDTGKAGLLLGRAAEDDVPVEVVPLDVTDDGLVEAAVAALEAEHGAIDVLVNNAGVGHSGAVETIDLDMARNVMETNFWGAVRTTRAVLPGMRARRSGVIVNVTSVAGRVPGSAFNGFYAASKHALGALTDALYMELEPYGIRVVCIEPGFFKTEVLANAGGADAGADNPYAADQDWMRTFYEKSVESTGADPRIVAEAIVAAATDPATPVHTLVGDDATVFVDLVEQSGTVEAWTPVGISIVESIAGPRPPLPS